MKKFILFLSLAFLVFAASFTAARLLERKAKNSLSIPAKTLFAPASHVLKNHPFTFVIAAFNNGGNVEKTLASVFSQNYDNFRLIYIDDASNDGSFEVARDAIYASDHLAHVTLVRNEERLGFLANLFRAVQECPNEEIIVALPGEDWLAHEWVLERLNAYYADPNLWLAIGQAIDFPTFQLPPSPDLRSRGAFSFGPHLKTFYASLFKQIKEADFIYAGTFLPAAEELAYMTPMLEMGKDHVHFISEVLCINNREKAHKEDRELIMRCEKFIRSLDPYPALTALEVTPCGD